MVALASAYVRVRADTSTFKNDIDRGLNGVGDRAARNVDKGFSARIRKSFNESGRLGGAAFSKGFDDGGGTFSRTVTSMAARATVLSGALGAATPVAAKFVAALAPATGIVVGLVPASVAAAAASGTLKVALSGVGDAVGKGLAGDTKAYEKALGELVPAQRTAAAAVVSFRGQINSLRQNVAQRFFKPLMDDIQPLGKTLLPVASKEMGGLAGRLGTLGSAVLQAARTAPVVQAVRDVFRGTGDAVGTVTGRVNPLIQAIARLVSSSMPILRTMAGDVGSLADRFTAWANEAAKSGRLVTIFNNARTTLGQLAALLGNLGSIARTVFGYSNGAAGDFLARLVELTAQARKWVESAKGAETLSRTFGTLASFGATLRSTLAGVLPEIAKSLSIGAPAASQFAAAAGRMLVSLGPLLPAITGIAAQLLVALVPAMNRLATWLGENQQLLRVIAPLMVAFVVASKAVAAATVVATAATKAWAVAMGVAKAGQAAWTAVSYIANGAIHLNTAAVKLNRSTIGTWIGVKAIEAKAWLSSVAGSAKATAGVVAHRVAMVASATASKAAAVAQAAWTAVMAGSTAIMAAVRNGVLAINAAMRANPIGAVITVIGLLVAALVVLYQRNETVRKVIDAVWAAIRKAISAVGAWFTGTLVPSMKRALDQAVAAFQFLWSWVQRIWGWIKSYIQFQINIVLTVFRTLRDFVTVTIPNAFNFLVGRVRAYIDMWRNIINTGWAFVRDRVFTPLRNLITQTIPNAFSSGVAAIGRAWDKVKEMARKPVAFVVNSVINPLIGGYNKIAGVFGAPKADTIKGFDSGGRIPGRPSNRDNRLATVMDAGRGALGAIKVATGEFIVNAKSTMANLPLIQAINRKRGRVDLGDIDPVLDGFAKGGLPGRRKRGQGDGIGGFLDKVWGGLKGAASFVTDPVKGLKKLFAAAMSRIPGAGQVIPLLKNMGQKLLGGVTKLLSDFGGGIGGGRAGGGSARMMAFLRQRFPGLRLISGYRPGATTLSGNPSWHGKDRAVDVPPIRAVAQYIKSTVGRNALELITPWRDLDLLRGKPHRYSNMIHNQHNFAGGNAHVHWAARLGGLVDRLSNSPIVRLMDKGGRLRSGEAAVNASGYDEHVLTGGPRGDIGRLIDAMEESNKLNRAILSALLGLGGDVALALQSATTQAAVRSRSMGTAIGRR